MLRKIETDRFRVINESGTEYLIIEYQERVSMAHGQNPGATKPGMKTLLTSTGLHVRQIDAESFEILDTEEIVRKI